MEAVESVWRFVVCGLRSAVGGRKNQWLAVGGGRSEESVVCGLRSDSRKNQWLAVGGGRSEESVACGGRWAVGRISGGKS